MSRTYTPEEHALVICLHQRGLTPQRIVDRLRDDLNSRRSKTSVTSHITHYRDRLGLLHRPPGPCEPPISLGGPDLARDEGDALLGPAPIISPTLRPAIPLPSAPTTLADRHDAQCCWPVSGTGAAMLYCPARADHAEPNGRTRFCRAHAVRAFLKTPQAPR